MRTITKTAVAATATAAGLAAYLTGRARRARPPGPAEPDDRRHVLTVFRPLSELTTMADRPAPLAALGDSVTVDLRAAPGDRGTEISVRRTDDRVSAGDVRRALRESRSLLEVGDVVQPGISTTEPTLTNKPLRSATEHGREGGLL
ncbi:hypothetical protein AB0M20_23380 [Actinoplanes sp. NPDC051633]|uniref:hypothetical protein n=1 Tax=Actinoplanes sp. NPDC051633 TaxID=3155670 RepID=UPI003446B3EF